MKKLEYHFEGIRTDGSRWALCSEPVTTIEEAREKAEKLLEDRRYDKVEIYVYERKIVETIG